MTRICVIGAGSSGIAACQVLNARGIAFDCYEKGSQIGGNWRYMNDNGMSSAYRSLSVDTSRERMSYRTFPMADHYPDYPHNSQIAAYFDEYADYFGFRRHITFNTEVTNVARALDGGWDVTIDGERTRRYDVVLVANGHHWCATLPSFPGEFEGEAIHSHHYKTPDPYADANVLVVGFGNSAVDIACETSRVSRMTFLAVRRGAHVIPKYIAGKPVDLLSRPTASRLPISIQRFFFARMVKLVQGETVDFGLPRPDHKLLEAHFTVSSELLTRIGHGRVTPKPNVERLEGTRVRFADGSSEEIDRIVYATGYRISFPFLPDELMPVKDNHVSLYRHVVHPQLPGLYFIGLIQPHGAFMPLAEAQAEWVADIVEGRARLPSPEDMRRAIDRERRRIARRYVSSPRHTIQVDFYPYLRTIARERRRTMRV
jgi:dimethylaniline monooxygenase (N-oxide forming)